MGQKHGKRGGKEQQPEDNSPKTHRFLLLSLHEAELQVKMKVPCSSDGARRCFIHIQYFIILFFPILTVEAPGLSRSPQDSSPLLITGGYNPTAV